MLHLLTAGFGTECGCWDVRVHGGYRRGSGRLSHRRPRRRAVSSPPALWPIIVAPGRIVETPATPAEAEVVTARDADIGRPRGVDDAALRLVVQRTDELRAIVGLAVQRLVRNDDRGPRQCG